MLASHAQYFIIQFFFFLMFWGMYGCSEEGLGSILRTLLYLYFTLSSCVHRTGDQALVLHCTAPQRPLCLAAHGGKALVNGFLMRKSSGGWGRVGGGLAREGDGVRRTTEASGFGGTGTLGFLHPARPSPPRAPPVFPHLHSCTFQHPVTPGSFLPAAGASSLPRGFKAVSILNRKSLLSLETSDKKRFMNAQKSAAT